jgi:peptidoglycan/LPS O-acetylase OafA/YrhL
MVTHPGPVVPGARYRPDIDGLRAIAVLAVIAFHANPHLVRGGFAGVDIFFVISGYLISGIIVRELDAGTFRFRDFYARRIKRILPAYIVVTLFTLAVATWLLIPNDYIFYTTSLAASWAFVSNIFFSMLSWGYFGSRTEEFPLLHTWSLSVEEQFYFIYPVLLLLLTRRFRHRLIEILLVLGIVFLGISQWGTGQVKTYFLLTARAHELIAGALAFLVAQRYPLRSAAAASAMAVAGLTMMTASLFMLTKGVAFPGINSLYPCVGAALVLYACGRENIVTPVLANRAMVFIGLLSYSLYLWHWPIFVFLRYRHVEMSPGVISTAIAGAFVLALLTWKFVENPIRHNRKIAFGRAFRTIYLAPAMVFIAIGLVSYVTEGLPQRFPEDIRQLISSYSFERDLSRSCSIRAEDYHRVTFEYLNDACAYGAMQHAKPEILLMGDSHANHFKPFVEFLARQANLKAVYHVQGSCSPIDLYHPDPAQPEPTVCQRRNADLLAMAHDFRYVVIAASWNYRGRETEFERDLSEVVMAVERAGAIAVIFKDNPDYQSDVSQCILRKRRGWIEADTNCNMPRREIEERQGSMDRTIDAVRSAHPHVLVVDPKDVMCTSDECETYIGNVALYKDSNHINAKAATLLAERYSSLKGNIFATGLPPRDGPATSVSVTAAAKSGAISSKN